jgi:hypothetical protein
MAENQERAYAPLRNDPKEDRASKENSLARSTPGQPQMPVLIRQTYPGCHDASRARGGMRAPSQERRHRIPLQMTRRQAHDDMVSFHSLGHPRMEGAHAGHDQTAGICSCNRRRDGGMAARGARSRGGETNPGQPQCHQANPNHNMEKGRYLYRISLKSEAPA